ncbi:MAG: helix-turn-helix transcriptional regulator, partial [Paludibacteraceae bacterium]|nr:helix-turn-helix transcriptional regulator [Paludibacteraceae bacterium]
GRQTIMDRFNLSKERVGSIFSQSEHSKLTNYILQLRMEYAAKMLVEQPAKSIVQIAQECGFSSHKYFTARFRQHYNMTPSEFRTAQQQTI